VLSLFVVVLEVAGLLGVTLTVAVTVPALIMRLRAV
jgi:hypothetical protein